LYGKRSGNRHDRVWVGLFAGAGDVCSREICGAGSEVGGRRRRILCTFRCAAIFGKCSISRSGAGVQTFGGDVSALYSAKSQQRDTPQEYETTGMGNGNSCGLCAAFGTRGENERGGASMTSSASVTNASSSKIFYGWWVVAAAFLNFFFIIAIIFYG